MTVSISNIQTPEVCSAPAARENRECNIAARLTQTAEKLPNSVAIAVPQGRDILGQRQYETITFRELDNDSSQLAAALRDYGYQAGDRVVLMVRPGIDFISLTYALFKAGIVVVLVDPGMGKDNMIAC
ncbi:MAG: AMP-binding protein, partial [Planctomycetales bacterium]|nr:AMP-binding protein [Planctomycetales bacterium]